MVRNTHFLLHDNSECGLTTQCQKFMLNEEIAGLSEGNMIYSRCITIKSCFGRIFLHVRHARKIWWCVFLGDREISVKPAIERIASIANSGNHRIRNTNDDSQSPNIFVLLQKTICRQQVVPALRVRYPDHPHLIPNGKITVHTFHMHNHFETIQLCCPKTFFRQNGNGYFWLQELFRPPQYTKLCAFSTTAPP